MKNTKAVYYRREKESNAATVLYEIDMLRFARDRLLSPERRYELDEWVYLEAFLLHYRNLIEFFGKEESKCRKGDLSIFRPDDIWPVNSPEKAVLDSMGRADLWEKYDTHDNDEAISKYLHHCTTHRIEAKRWDVSTMYEELRPTVEKFESLLPQLKPRPGLAGGRVVAQATLDAMSTSTTRVSMVVTPPK